MTIHIDYDREENRIELILDSQGNVIRTLVLATNCNISILGWWIFKNSKAVIQGRIEAQLERTCATF